MKNVLFDTNIILDIALSRQPYYSSSSKLFDLIDQEKIAGYVSASTVTDIYYISKKVKGNSKAIQFISNLIEIVDVIGVDKAVIISALKANIKDFEDAVQVSAAVDNGIEIIITRNTSDFSKSKLKIFTPDEFVKQTK